MTKDCCGCCGYENRQEPERFHITQSSHVMESRDLVLCNFCYTTPAGSHYSAGNFNTVLSQMCLIANLLFDKLVERLDKR